MTAGDPPGERGTTTIAERVVARITREAVDETADAGGLDKKMLGVQVPGGGRAARTDVRIEGSVVTARVRMSIAYPAPVRETAHRVRDHVRERVESMTGLSVRNVDIDVAELERPEPERAGRRAVVA
ncbi:Asp23/Gls24 family envelope stress response protein [Spirillospora sp. CA-294931]|uniref:Asp23/Gls24 family envelope stress response protein n=1 Tax=Spirillospora sp. CA-294931 TaxID=3240042 RepID=UPI003D91B645